MTAGPTDSGLWSRFLAHPDRSGIFVDFDGTLAPIVGSPPDAVAFPGAVEVLAHLARSWGLVAVVSGRPVAFLARHLDLSPSDHRSGVRAFGLYGLEWSEPDGSYRVDPEASQWAAVVEKAAQAAEAGAPAGLEVERKGLTLTLHWRHTPELAAWARGQAEAESSRSGLVWSEGRMSLELRPPVGGDKGSVVERMSGDLSSVAYLGDDRADLDAFDALDRLATIGVATVRVAVKSSEAPADLLARADVVVDGPAGAHGLLAALIQ